jgi:hydrogenase maturation protease
MERWTEVLREAPERVVVAGREIRRGSRVRLRPGPQTDVLLRALAGRCAIVDAVEQDLEDNVLLAVVLEDDPARVLGKARSLAHRFFFSPQEVEPIEDAALTPQRRVLVAGIGNVFLGDDGFGVAVARALASDDVPSGVTVADFGIRGMDLAYALGDGYDAALLVDAAPLGEPPGTLRVIEPDPDEACEGAFEGHGMNPVRVLALARRLGGLPARTLILGCEPERLGDLDEGEIVADLSPSVRAAVERAVPLVRSLLSELLQSDSEGRNL